MSSSIGRTRAATYWRKTYSIEAVRLTPENMSELADFLGGDFVVDKHPDLTHVSYNGDYGHAGEWLVKEGESYFFLDHEKFSKKYRTHSEQESEDDKYAKVYQIVTAALQKQSDYTYHDQNKGVDEGLAIRVTNSVLRNL